jgi:uncharacterized protein (DUF1501 family)
MRSHGMKRRSFLGFLAGLPFGWFATAQPAGANARSLETIRTITIKGSTEGIDQVTAALDKLAIGARRIERRTFREDELVQISSVTVGSRP